MHVLKLEFVMKLLPFLGKTLFWLQYLIPEPYDFLHEDWQQRVFDQVLWAVLADSGGDAPCQYNDSWAGDPMVIERQIDVQVLCAQVDACPSNYHIWKKSCGI